MKWALATVVLAACGRIGFDAPSALVQAMSSGCRPCDSNFVTLPRPISTGSLLVAMLFTCAPLDVSCPTPTITDTVGNAWSAPTIVGTAAGHGAIYMWYACGAKGGPDDVAVINGSTSYGMLLLVHDVAGIAAASCLDAIGTNTSTGGDAVVMSTAVTHPDEYVVAFFADFESGGSTAVPSSYTAGTGHSIELATTAGGDSAVSEDPSTVGPLGGPQIATATKTNTSDTYQAMIATFVAAR